MKLKIIASFVILLFATQAEAGKLLPASAGDLVGERLATLSAPAGTFERKPVNFAWGLDPYAELAPAMPLLAESREFWLQADGEQLRRGIDLDTSAAGALVRISPAKGGAVPIDALRLIRDGQRLEGRRAFAQLADARALQAAGMDVPHGSVVARLAPDLGQGRFHLQLAGASGNYLVHVFEPASDVVLRAGAQRASLLAGDTLHVTADFTDKGRSLAGDVAGLLVSPSGASYDLRFVPRRGGGFEAVSTAPLDAAATPGLWEVQVLAGATSQGQRRQRDVRTAIGIAQPTARLGGDYDFDAGALRLDLPLQVGSPGRYQVGAVLYATGSDGVARPIAQAQAAAWLEAGARRLALAFDREHVPGSYGAPFEVRFLELKDQTRMGLLETRERAARILR